MGIKRNDEGRKRKGEGGRKQRGWYGRRQVTSRNRVDPVGRLVKLEGHREL